MQKSPLVGIGLMIASMACFAVMNSCVRGVSASMPPAQMVLLRNILALIIITPLALWLGHGSLRTERPWAHFWRAAIGIVSMEIWFYALSILKLSFATALSFTSPIFATVFAIVLLGEKAGPRRWIAIGAGFAGALVILQPAEGAMDKRGLIVLVSSAMMALAATVVKTLTKTESPEIIVFYMALFMTPLSLPLGVWVWQPVAMKQIAGLLAVAVSSTAAHLLLTRAYRRADMVVLMPFDFFRLLFTAVLAQVYFGETMGKATVAGALIIVASSAYIAHREARHAVPQKKEDILEGI
jgi:drug/metabolite transporter (DMT)-like permease